MRIEKTGNIEQATCYLSKGGILNIYIDVPRRDYLSSTESSSSDPYRRYVFADDNYETTGIVTFYPETDLEREALSQYFQFGMIERGSFHFVFLDRPFVEEAS